MKLLKLLKYLWAFPNTLLGLLLLPVVLLTGGDARVYQGCLELIGGHALRWMLELLDMDAMTLGHVILGFNDVDLHLCRDHEHVHVRQNERFGPFFIPAYFASSALALIAGCDPYYDNYFEMRAYAAGREDS
jgi:hypothetical protein